MSDVDGKDSVNTNTVSSRKKSRRIDDFPQAIGRIAMAQVCEGLGFQGFQQSALDCLTDVAVRYIREVGKVSSSRAGLDNRTECNVFDLIQGLEDLGLVQGFSGALDVGRPLSGSGVVSDIIRYVGEAEEIPFAYSVPGFPVVKERRLNPSFVQLGEVPSYDYVPSWLPKFPESGVNAGNNKESGGLVDENLQRFELQNRQVEKPAVNLNEGANCNGSELGINPYLLPPLQFGEREIELPVLPAKFLEESASASASQIQNHEVKENHVSVVESLLPENKPYDKRRMLSNGRPNVNFKLANSKKSLGMRRGFQSDGVEEISVWFTDDSGEKDGI